MEPKKKAQEIFDKMIYHIMYNCQPTLSTIIAKECALICCDEILHYSKSHGFIGLTDYWKQVKKEINDL